MAGLIDDDALRVAMYWLDRLGLTDRAAATVQDLSHGNQHRVRLAVALAHDPDLLMLDDPFAGLDPVAVRTMSAIIAERASAGLSHWRRSVAP